jgi:hypothetical protein
MEKVKMGWKLKLKSLIYKYTGVYLAHKEENDYFDTDEYWEQFLKFLKSEDLDMGPRNVHGLMVGMWQARYGFARPASFLKYRRPRPIFRFLGWFADLFIVLKWDAISVYRILKPYKPELTAQLAPSSAKSPKPAKKKTKKKSRK